MQREERLSDQPVEQPKLNLTEIIKKEEDLFQNFYVIVWTPRPDRDNVKVILDEGNIKIVLKRDKFIQLLHDILPINRPGTDRNFFYIKESVRRYGGIFYYNRAEDKFKEVLEIPDFEKLRPIDLIDEGRKMLQEQSRGPENNKFQELMEANEEFKKIKTPWKSFIDTSGFSKFQTPIITKLTKKKKKKTL